LVDENLGLSSLNRRNQSFSIERVHNRCLSALRGQFIPLRG
jgi:hypothetical protein